MLTLASVESVENAPVAKLRFIYAAPKIISGIVSVTIYNLVEGERVTSEMPVDYSKWKDIEVSDDEDDTHPNVDTPSLFRWRHEVRFLAFFVAVTFETWASFRSFPYNKVFEAGLPVCQCVAGQDFCAFGLKPWDLSQSCDGCCSFRLFGWSKKCF